MADAAPGAAVAAVDTDVAGAPALLADTGEVVAVLALGPGVTTAVDALALTPAAPAPRSGTAVPLEAGAVGADVALPIDVSESQAATTPRNHASQHGRALPFAISSRPNALCAPFRWRRYARAGGTLLPILTIVSQFWSAERTLHTDGALTLLRHLQPLMA